MYYTSEVIPVIDMESVVMWAKSPVAAEVGDEVVLMQLSRGRCYGLGLVGTEIWKRLSQPIKVSQVVDSLCEEYSAERETIAVDLIEALTQYAAEGLIDVDHQAC